jgi:hypothetical protein
MRGAATLLVAGLVGCGPSEAERQALVASVRLEEARLTEARRELAAQQRQLEIERGKLPPAVPSQWGPGDYPTRPPPPRWVPTAAPGEEPSPRHREPAPHGR